MSDKDPEAAVIKTLIICGFGLVAIAIIGIVLADILGKC